MKKLKFTPFPVLETKRLVLRQLEDADAQFIYDLRISKENNRFLDLPIPKDTSQTQAYITRMNKGISEDKYIYWAITERNSSQMIGTICLWNLVEAKRQAELGYELHHNFQKQGYMREAFAEVVSYAREDLGMKILEAYTQQGNIPSLKLLEHFGFEKVNSIAEKHSKTGQSFVQLVYKKEYISG